MNNEELENILMHMDIPKLRIKDLNWLNRNLAINNSNHPDFEKAINLIKQIQKENK